MIFDRFMDSIPLFLERTTTTQVIPTSTLPLATDKTYTFTVDWTRLASMMGASKAVA